MSEGSDSSVESELVGQNVLDVLGLDGIKLSVESTLGDDDDGFTLAELSVLFRGRTRRRRELLCGTLGEESR